MECFWALRESRTRLALLTLLWVVHVGAAAGPNLLENGSFEQAESGWEPFGQGYVLDRANVAHGKISLRCENLEREDVSGAMQQVQVNQEKPVPLVIRATSRSKGVVGMAGPNYSVWCDVEYITDSRPGRVDLPGRKAGFRIGGDGWTTAEATIVPTAPIKFINVYVLFRHRYTGVVWFDDVYLGTLTDGPLVGGPPEFPPVADGGLPDTFRARLVALPPSRGLLHVSQAPAAGGVKDPLPLWLNGRLVTTGGRDVPRGTTHELPWTFPRHAILPLDTPSFAQVQVTRVSGKVSACIETRSVDLASLDYLMALPTGIAIEGVEMDSWETSSDDLQVRSLGDRVLVFVRTVVESDADSISFNLSSLPTESGLTSKRRATPRQYSLKTTDGLVLVLADDGWIDAVQVDGGNLSDGRSSHRTAAPTGGLTVRDLFGERERPVGGTVTADKGGFKQSSVLADDGLEVDAFYVPQGDRIDVEIEVRDLLDQDRALNLTFRLPVSLDNWLWCEDITQTRPFEAEKTLESSIYPWAVVAASDESIGIALAIPPHRPAEFAFVCDPPAGHVAVRFRLGISQAGKTPGRVKIAFSVFRTSGHHAFRDATRRYYEAFPELFRRTALHEGGWLFACPTAKLKNPEDYAYHEGGPGGLELDETLGILTCPYRIPTQRQIVFPSLPESDEEAIERIRNLSRASQPRNWKTRGATLDKTGYDGGTYSLLCEKNDETVFIGASQDVELGQAAAKAILIGGRCRAYNVSGVPDKDFGLYADLWFTDGTRLYGQCVQFSTGTHDWEEAQITVAPAKPVRMIRLHVLMRRKHAGRAWFDDLFIRESGSDVNHVQNPKFEEAEPHAYATMMERCASHDAKGNPYILRRDNVGADVLPKNPIYNVVYAVNCDSDLFADTDERLTVGRYELELIEGLLARRPKLDGIYLDSTSGWVTRYPNYRREHFRYVDHALSYDPVTGRVIAPGWMHTYEFMRELRKRLNANGKIVFPNNGRGRRWPFLFFVCDVIGLEGGLRRGDFEEQLNFYRALAGQRPVLVMDYLEVLGKLTRHGSREGFERFWKWCALYGVHPSIGRSCVEAYEQFGDVYRRFREPLKLLGKAGWEPITHAASEQNVRIERFGDAERGFYVTVLNPETQAQIVRVTIDTAALQLPASASFTDILSGTDLGNSPLTLSLAAEDIAILSCHP